MRSFRLAPWPLGVSLAMVSCGALARAQPVTTLDLEDAARDGSSWLSYGRDYFGQRFVRLPGITPANVARLRPAWVFATGGENRGLQAIPLVHKGVISLDHSPGGGVVCLRKP